MQREEKQYESALDAILMRLNDIKIAIGSMLHKLETEYETMNWPNFLDNFALISSQLTGLSKLLAKDLCPPLRNRTLLPLMLTPERDEQLVNLTEGRLPIFSHDIVPDYLRTKPDPIVEQKMLQNESKAANLSAEVAMKQVTQYNKIISHILDMIGKAREEWEMESSTRPGIQQTSSMTDTHALVAAVGMGKGLRPIPLAAAGPGGMMVPPNLRPNAPLAPAGSQAGSIGKAPSAIKTNIKSAMQVHPFSR